MLFGKANGGQTNVTDDVGDGVTNNGHPISTYQCSGCNVHMALYADDDGGYLRLAVGAYYAAAPPTLTGPGGAYHPLDPARILDTRSNLGGHPGALGAGQTMTLQVAGAGGAPAGAYAAVMNVTATDTTAASYLTVYPADATQPTSHLTGHDDLATATTFLARYAKTFHFVGNSIYEIDGDNATGEVYCVARHLRVRDDDTTDFVWFIRYIDRYERRDGTWLIADRTLRVDWTETHPGT